MKQKVFDHIRVNNPKGKYYLGKIVKPENTKILGKIHKTATLAELYAERVYFRYISLKEKGVSNATN